jgi:monofunctional biosynthetic peptidoglycan transglycosylase
MVLEWVRHGGDVRWIHLRKNWRTLGEISPDLRKAVLAAEDQRFLSHHGFDFIELRHAVADVLSGKGVRGASTISMQTARTVFLCHDRNLIRKIAEAYYTALLEFFCSKKRILEIYLNTVDWGRGARGAESACRLYFERSCGEITRKQAARLAAILPSPHRWSPVNPGKIVLRREKRILQDLSRMPAL